MAGILERLKKRFEHTFPSASAAAGICDSYTLDQTRDLLAHGASISQRAKTATAFLKYSDVLGSGGDKLAEAATKLDGLIKKGKGAVGDVSSACEISEAVDVLNQWTLDGSKVSSQDAAKAFDKLFGGAAHYFEKLPPPVNAYARVLSSIAEFKFFSNMQNIMDPESPNTPRGRQMRQVLDSIDK